MATTDNIELFQTLFNSDEDDFENRVSKFYNLPSLFLVFIFGDTFSHNDFVLHLLSAEFSVSSTRPVQFPGEFTIFPFTGLNVTSGTTTKKANGFEISMLIDSRYMLKNMYRVFPWGDRGILIQHPSTMYDLVYNEAMTNMDLAKEITDEHKAFRTVIKREAKQLKKYSLLAFEDTINHEFMMVPGKNEYPTGTLQKLDSSFKIQETELKNNLFHRSSWRIVTDTRLLEETVTNNDNDGLDAITALLKRM
jgi:hypothetical protein